MLLGAILLYRPPRRRNGDERTECETGSNENKDVAQNQPTTTDLIGNDDDSAESDGLSYCDVALKKLRACCKRPPTRKASN